ncbi:MAG: hypothetical protein EBS76_07520, partial [Actinobacteria bacterium]|nr:hypothetical protein [Actinomycetota bacterium]
MRNSHQSDGARPGTRIAGVLAMLWSLVALIGAPSQVAASQGCTSGFGIDGVVEASGVPINGASVEVRVFAVNYAGPFSLSKLFESSPIISAFDGTYEYCSLSAVSSFDVPATAQVIVSLAITPPSDLYGPEAGEYGVTVHRSVLGTVGELAEQPYEVNGELLAAQATGQVTTAGAADLTGVSVRYIHSFYPVIDIGISARNDGWFGLATNNPER